MRNKWLAASELLLATTIWGFGFTASMWALTAFDAVSISIIRFGVAFVIGFVILAVQRSSRRYLDRAHFLYSMIPGLSLGLSLCLQTWGLEYTTATKSGFITTLYVVLVPIFEAIFFRNILSKRHFIWVGIALIGTALMVQLQLGQLNRGDLFTFGCALTSAIQIIFIGRSSHHIKSVLSYNTFQSFWAVVVSFAFWPLYGRVHWSAPNIYAFAGLFSLAFLSTLLAFALQIKAQKVLSSSTSSLIFLLESPFAAIFAMIFLHESLTLWQTIGGVLIFTSAFQATRGSAHEPRGAT
jgi:drug/metabolite transporter (DMT)-like permease